MSDCLKLVLPTLLVITLVALAYKLLGPIPAIVFLVAFGGGLVLYINTTWRAEFDTTKIIQPYLLTVLFFMVHTFEEYVTNFEDTVSRMAGRSLSESGVLFIIAWIAPIMWVGGALLLIKRWAFGYYFLCAFFVAMVISELSHYVFPFMIDGTFHYESGMYTALLPLLPAAYGLHIMLREVKSIQVLQRTHQ